MDIRIVDKNQNSTGGINAASIEKYTDRNALAVTLVNTSGSTYNATGGGGGSGSGDGAILDGVNGSLRATVLSGPTTRTDANSNPQLVQLADDPTRQLGVISHPVMGVQIVGGSVGARVSISGDQLAVTQQGVWTVQQGGGWAHAITGDVLLRSGSFADPRGPIGAQLVGSSIRLGVSGDVNVSPAAGQSFPVTQSGSWSIAGSGDMAIVDGASRSVKATVRAYVNSNPQAVVLTNPSGDSYLPTPREPLIVTIAGRITAAGTTTIAGPYNGRVIKVTSIEMQGESSSDTMARLGSAASGDAMSNRWIFNAREGIAMAVSPLGGGYIRRTNLNQALVMEHFDSNPVNFCVSFHTGDSF